MPFDLARDQLVLGLRGELRVRQLHGQDGRQAFARIIAGGVELVLLRRQLLLDVIVQRARQRAAEARQVRAAIFLRNVVGVAVHALLVGVVPLDRHLDGDRAVLSAEPEHRLVNRCAGAVQILDEGLQAAFVLEDFRARFALIVELDAHAGVQERQLAQALGENVEMELDVREDLARWA